MHIGNKTHQEWARLLTDRGSWHALGRMLTVHENPVRALYDQVVPGRRYPLTCRVKTPIGPTEITLFHVADMSTLNLVFSREDYLCPANAKVVVDIGANIGIAATYFLTRNREAYAYLFEPAPNVLPRLRANMEKFAGRYELSEIAIADRSGPVHLALEETGRNGMITEQATAIVAQAEHINTALGRIVARHGAIDCLKLDVESYEERLLGVLEPALWKRIRLLNVEATERFPCIPPQFQGDVRGSAFRLWNRDFAG